MHVMIKRALIATPLAAAAAMCAAHPGHPPIPTPTITVSQQAPSVPFELFRGNRLIVPATINGHQTEVMLDTGASLTSLNHDYARSIGLPPGFKIQAKGAGGAVEAEMATGLTVQLGGFTARNASVGVIDLAPIERALGRPISAVVGRDFFNSAVISIDWAARRLKISSRDGFSPGPGATSVSLKKKGPFNTVPISIAGAAPIDALLDLGNGGALVLPKTYWGSRPELNTLKSAGSMVGGVGGLHSARVAMVPDVSLGGEVFKAVPAILSESGNDEDPTQMANVGIGLLKQFKVDLDLGNDRIFLTPRADAPPFDRERAGVRTELSGDRLKVMFVSPEGPSAAAGLKAGDEIVAIDGSKVTPAYYQSADWTREAAGKPVVLKRADGSEVTVILKDYY